MVSGLSGGMIDNIKAGDKARIKLCNAGVENDRQGIPTWRINPPEGQSRITFSLKCNATRQNYVTVKFKGGESTHERLYLADAEGKILYDKINRELVLLDDPSSVGIRPEGWFYVTVPVPKEMTSGKSSVNLSIVSRGRDKGYSNRKTDYEQTIPSRAIYRIYSHADAEFSPVADDNPGKVVKPYLYPDYKPLNHVQIKKLQQDILKVADDQTQHIMNTQFYAPDWRKKVKSGQWPECMVGAFSIRGMPKSGAFDLSQVKNQTAELYIRYDNLGPLSGAAVLGQAYNLNGSKFYHSRELLDRIALALDFARRAQGANGAYVDVWDKKWVGGPKRRTGAGSLEGYAHGSLGKAFLAVQEDMEKNGLLDELVDDDADDTTPPIPRRQAYIALFSQSVDYLKDRNGHAPNQDSMNVLGIFPQVKALKLLAPSQPSPAETVIRKRALGTAGLLGTPSEFTWVSPKGLSLEPRGSSEGGYTCEYGQNQPGEYFRLARYSGYPEIMAVAEKAASAYPYFWYPVFRADGKIELRAEGFINWRNIIRNGKNIAPVVECALELKNPYQIRAFQLKIINGELSDIKNFKPVTGGGHHYTGANDVMAYAGDISTLLNRLPADPVRLPMESGQPDFAWADELAQAVAVKHGESRIFAALNWRHPANQASGFARIHLLSPELEIMATIKGQNIDGQYGFNLYRYGNLLIAMNSSLTKSYPLPLPEDFKGRKLIDLISGKELGSNPNLSPRSTVVIYSDIKEQP